MAGTWQPLAHQPTFDASTMLLLTDGTVMCQAASSTKWWKLTPDAFGNYVNGTWSALADGPNAPLYYASAVLRDGRVFVAGGEYNNNIPAELLAAEIYDPLANTWTNLPTPAGWAGIGDAASCALPDGRVLLGYLWGPDCAVFDPATNAWAAVASKNNASTSEETWTLLPDQTVLSVDCTGHPAAEKYIMAADKWVSAGSTPTDLVEAASIEIGPALLLPDGRLFAIGATGRTAIYTMPAIANQLGTWASGPTFPLVLGQQLGAKDAPGCLLPNGRVLCVAGPVDGVSGNYLAPTYFFEYAPAANTLTAITNPPNSGGRPYEGRMLLLPTGQVLFSDGSTDVEVYTPDGAPDPSWKPQITSAPASVRPGRTYTLSGRQINGLSQAVSYGDDAMMATNYPIVRIRHLATGHIAYCRTHDHSTLGVQTGTVIHTTQFTVPWGIDLGPSELCVIANGITADCISVGVSNKGWKEIKWEIKENIKAEIDIFFVEKKIIEDKRKDAVDEGDPWRRFGEDPEWLKVTRLLAERSDELEAQLRQRAFIQEGERPTLGEEALEASAQAVDERVAREAARHAAAQAAHVQEERTAHVYHKADLPPSRPTTKQPPQPPENTPYAGSRRKSPRSKR
jgi:hypothetical protein